MKFLTNPIVYLITSIVALYVGPLVHSVIKDKKASLRFFDGFVLVVIVGLVTAHIIPHIFEDIGWPALIVVFLGLLLPTFLENKLHGTLAKKTHVITLLLAVVGISLHEFTDGLALAQNPVANGMPTAVSLYLPVAIVLHRLPVGLVLWWLIKPAYGVRRALFVITGLAIATVIGFETGNMLNVLLEHKFFGLFEALVAGSLLHVIFHRHDAFTAPENCNKWQVDSGAGALLGFATLIALDQLHFFTSEPEAPSEFFTIFFNLAAIGAPSLVFAYIVSGLISGLMPQSSFNWLRKGSSFGQALRGMAFGLPLPVCSCGVIPLYRSLVKQGTPLAAALAFFVATPELGIDAFLLSLPLLGLSFTLVRLACAVLIALLVGWILGYLFRGLNADFKMDETPDTKQLSWKERIIAGLRVGLEDAVDHTAPWILLGLVVAAIAAPTLEATQLFAQIPPHLDVIFFALLGMPLYVCASGVTPVVAVLIAGGVSPGAAVAFLLTGPATNISTIGVLAQLHGKKLAFSFAGLMAFVAISLGYIVNFFIPATAIVATHEITSSHAYSSSQIIFLFLFGLLFLFSLLRRGPRYLINQIVAFESATEHSHDHSEHDHHQHHPDDPCCGGSK